MRKGIPDLQKAYPDGSGIFQQNLAPCHMSEKVMKHFQTHEKKPWTGQNLTRPEPYKKSLGVLRIDFVIEIALPRPGLSSSSFGRASTPGQTQIGLGPRAYPFTTTDCCTARIRYW